MLLSTIVRHRQLIKNTEEVWVATQLMGATLDVLILQMAKPGDESQSGVANHESTVTSVGSQQFHTAPCCVQAPDVYRYFACAVVWLRIDTSLYTYTLNRAFFYHRSRHALDCRAVATP